MTLNIVGELKKKAYGEILTLAGESCTTFSLVWRDQLPFNSSAKVIEDALKPFLVREERTDERPGTQLINHLATVRHYRVSPESIRVLQEVPDLYAWLSPDRPEDLAFYTGDGKTWLGSVAHEKDAWFADLPGLQSTLQGRIPDVKVVQWEPE